MSIDKEFHKEECLISLVFQGYSLKEARVLFEQMTEGEVDQTVFALPTSCEDMAREKYEALVEAEGVPA